MKTQTKLALLASGLFVAFMATVWGGLTSYMFQVMNGWNLHYGSRASFYFCVFSRRGPAWLPAWYMTSRSERKRTPKRFRRAWGRRFRMGKLEKTGFVPMSILMAILMDGEIGHRVCLNFYPTTT